MHSASKTLRVVLQTAPVIAAFAIVSAFAPSAEAARVSRPPQAATTADSAVPATLRSIIAKTLKVNESRVTASASFVKDLGADEVALVELVMAYEREFKIRISDAEAAKFLQVRDVVAYLRKNGAVK